MYVLLTENTSRRARFQAARSAAMQRASRASAAVEDSVRTADVLVVGGADSLLVPVVDVLDGCGWTVRYQANLDTAVEWLKANRTCVTLMEADATWRTAVPRLQSANGGRVILAARTTLPIEETMTAGAHHTLRVPLDSYDLLWSLVTARREAQAEFGSSRRFP